MGASNMAQFVLGRAAEIALPALAREIDESRNPGRAAKVKTAIVYARLRRAVSRGDTALMDNAVAAFWNGPEGARYHATHIEARFQSFKDKHAKAIDALAGYIAVSCAPLVRLVEIGCGNGQVLAECASRLPTIRQAIGLDINAAVIAQAIEEHANDTKLAFFNVDARRWLEDHPQTGTVMLSNNGVLEYFTPESVDRLYHTLAEMRPAAAVLAEPVAAGHDLDRQEASCPVGRGDSFSHNHRRRLERAGFRVMFEEEAMAIRLRMRLIVGVQD